jgi:hypothetical protein
VSPSRRSDTRPSSNFAPHALRWREIPSFFLHHFGDPGLPWLFAEAFLVMGGFVTLYNYIGFRRPVRLHGGSDGQEG